MSEQDWHNDLASLRAEVAHLNKHRYIRMHNSTIRLLWFNFLRGLAFGLGSVLGATVLVAFLAYLLREVNFIPIVGEWATQILEIITDQKAN